MGVVGPFKVVTVGDGMVGKTCMLITYARNEFPTDYVPCVFDNHACTIKFGRRNYSLTLWDTAGQEDYERVRPLCYPGTSCFLVCYSISNRTSYKNVLSKWWPEIKTHLPKTPIVLVGTKSDERRRKRGKFVTPDEGLQLKRQINAHAFVECSAKEKHNLEKVFECVVLAAEKAHCSRRCCTLL
ncbi:ras-like GTP-binding protein RhoL [Anopheles ziemanni]|uniref:ras-like GTP-binding protein RhoL n=1 Tax=Anopheles coustani TaxID=139045 RepID=UPI00265B4FE9|nr:ras-like GTP-binding protein RhoL [Anopheles coustani]XP_058169352.1 ras-like GTP-binding protein RhoL [Anopheles ziemanni]